jgi:Kef-type K+ transport system membrane component KefB
VVRMRQASSLAFLVALCGVIVPFGLGTWTGYAMGLSWKTACFLGGALTATSVSISARTLMDGGHMATTEATVILGAAVIDDVMGLFVLALLAASSTAQAAGAGLAPLLTGWLQDRVAPAAAHPLLAQMTMIGLCVTVFFVAGYRVARRWLDPLLTLLRRLTATESLTSCVLGLVLVYAISAEWLGSVAGITGAYLLGFAFAESKYKQEIERSFQAIGHGLLIPLFFVGIGLASDYHALAGHWGLMLVILAVAIVGKLIGCGLAAYAMGMDWVRSLRIGCGMLSRGEVGLIVTSMGAAAGMFSQSEVAVMIAVVLLTTFITPIALRGAFQLKSTQDLDEVLERSQVLRSQVAR